MNRRCLGHPFAPEALASIFSWPEASSSFIESILEAEIMKNAHLVTLALLLTRHVYALYIPWEDLPSLSEDENGRDRLCEYSICAPKKCLLNLLKSLSYHKMATPRTTNHLIVTNITVLKNGILVCGFQSFSSNSALIDSL
jgi:hypothetical protein